MEPKRPPADPADLREAEPTLDVGADAVTADVTPSPGPPAPAGGRLRPGDVLASRYRILAFAGRGGMAEVYRAHDLTLDQTVALKLLPAAFSRDRDRVARLFNEVRVARQVSHPNVCRVYDVSEADGRHFLSMEWIDGEDLSALLARKGRLPADEAMRIARQIAAGIAAAHERLVVHRDLKPSNVMVDERGVARVTDFGLAEAVAVSGPRAREGTPAYMAPEQLAGREATFASDLYALGLVLYQLFTGRPAYDATTATDLERQRREPPAPPSRLAPGLEEVDRVILDCLALEPGRRPASAHDVAAALGVDEAQARALAAAQQRTDRIEAFRAELAEVRRAGLLHVSEQELAAVETYHERLLSDLVRRFDVDVSERGKQLSLGMRVASIVGAIAMAASVFYFFYSVWGAIPVPLGIAILVTAPVLALLGTDVIARREPAGHFTTMAALLAVACFVTDVVALGSLFSMTSTSMPFLLVGAFALVVAYGYELRLPLVVGLFCLTLFVAGTVHEWAGGLWAYWAARPETLLPAGALLLAGGLLTPRSVHPGFALIYRVLALITLLWPSVLLGQGVDASFLPLAVSTTAVLHQVVGFLLGAGAVWLGVARRQRDLVYGGTFAVVLQLFLRFGYWWWDWMPRYLFFLVVALAALGILLLLRRLRSVVTSVIEEGRP